MEVFAQWLVVRIRTCLKSERGDVLVILLVAFLIWLVVTGSKVIVQ